MPNIGGKARSQCPVVGEGCVMPRFHISLLVWPFYGLCLVGCVIAVAQ